MFVQKYIYMLFHIDSMKFAPEHLQGQFNSGLAIIYRLNDIHNRLYSAAETLNYEGWYRALISFFKEVSRSMDEEELSAHQEFWKAVTTDYFKLRELKTKNKAISDEHLNSFHMWELKLNYIEQKYGMGMPKKLGGRHAMAD